MDLALYKELHDRIRNENRDVILNFTTGEGGRFIPSEHNPQEAANGSTLCLPERRVEHIEVLRPEVCTLDFNTMWSGQAAVINSPRSIEIMARKIYGAGVKPEIELFGSGDINMMLHFLERGIIKPPLMIQIVLGVRYGAIANTQTLQYFVSQLPSDCEWAAFGIGKDEFPMVAQSWLLGGHVRVGMEDNLHIRKGELCKDNAQLVKKARHLIDELGGAIASPTEARELLGILPP